MKRLFLFIPVVLMLVNGCKREGCNNEFAFNYDPNGSSEENCIWEPMPFNIHLKVMTNGQEVELGKEYTPDSGRAITFNHIGIYFTELSVYQNGEKQLLNDDVMLLLDSNRTFSTIFTPSAAIDSLWFNVGVNAERNDTLDPSSLSSGPLSQQVPSMWWSWQSNYRFILIEGIVDTSTAMDGSGLAAFQYHTGTNELLRQVTINSAPSVNAKVISYDLVVDLDSIFYNVDFKTEYATHTSDNMELAQKISDNAAKAIYAK